MQDLGSVLDPTDGGQNGGFSERAYRITATLSASQKDALQELASKYKVSVAWLIRQAIDRFIREAAGAHGFHSMRAEQRERGQID